MRAPGFTNIFLDQELKTWGYTYILLPQNKSISTVMIHVFLSMLYCHKIHIKITEKVSLSY